jgi:hypothetical protein
MKVMESPRHVHELAVRFLELVHDAGKIRLIPANFIDLAGIGPAFAGKLALGLTLSPDGSSPLNFA